METSPLTVRGCKFWLILGTCGHWAERVLAFACHTYCDTGHQWTPETRICCQAFNSGAITTCFNDFGLLRSGFKHPIFCLREKRSNRLQPMSLVEIGPVVLERNSNMWTVYRRRTTASDQRSSLESEIVNQHHAQSCRQTIHEMTLHFQCKCYEKILKKAFYFPLLYMFTQFLCCFWYNNIIQVSLI